MAVFGGLVLSAALPVLGLPETRGKPLVQTVVQVNISRVFDDVGEVDDGGDGDDILKASSSGRLVVMIMM